MRGTSWNCINTLKMTLLLYIYIYILLFFSLFIFESSKIVMEPTHLAVYLTV